MIIARFGSLIFTRSYRQSSPRQTSEDNIWGANQPRRPYMNILNEKET